MRKKHWLIIGAVVLVAIVTLVLLLNCNDAAYDKVCDDGYHGTAEELIAALVGEQKAPGIEKSAYAIACENGYAEDFDHWMQTIAGATTSDTMVPAYTVACENGYEGSLAQWLDSLVEDPEELGKSSDGEKKTEYELACEYGFEGTFSEWMVSLANETIDE